MNHHNKLAVVGKKTRGSKNPSDPQKKNEELDNPVECPQCNIGQLLHFRTIEFVQPVLRIIPDGCADLGEVVDSDALDCYIGCTECDFMGSGRDVLRLMQPPSSLEPRYIAYEIAPTPSISGRTIFVLNGILPDLAGKPLPAGIYEGLGEFSDETIAIARLYRISGIVGVPGQTYYPLHEEPRSTQTVH